MSLDFDILEDQRYPHATDVTLRLDKTVILYKGEPYYVTSGDPELPIIQAWKLPIKSNTSAFLIDANDKDINVSSISVGYMNINKDTYYLSRTPVRKQKQGICHHNLVYSRIGSFESNDIPSEWVKTEAFYNSITGNFHSFKDTLEWLTKEIKGYDAYRMKAISQDVCLFKKDNEPIRIYRDQVYIGDIVNERAKIKPLYLDSILVIRLSELSIGIY